MEASQPQTALGAGVIPVPAGRERYTLPSGAVCDMKPGKGKDLRLAARMVGDVRDDAVLYEFALIAIKCQLDGRDLTLEDVDELPDTDVATLLGIVRGKVQSDQARADRAEQQESSTPGT